MEQELWLNNYFSGANCAETVSTPLSVWNLISSDDSEPLALRATEPETNPSYR